MQIVSIGDNLHEMSKPVFLKKKKKKKKKERKKERETTFFDFFDFLYTRPVHLKMGPDLNLFIPKFLKF